MLFYNSYQYLLYASYVSSILLLHVNKYINSFSFYYIPMSGIIIQIS